MTQTYRNTFSDSILASIFSFRACLKVFYYLNINITSSLFYPYMIDHILDIYLIVYLSSKNTIIKKYFSICYNPCSNNFCISKFSSLSFCLLSDIYNNQAELSVLNFLGIVYYFIFMLFKSSQNIEQNNLKVYKTYYSPFLKKCMINNIIFSNECVFCFEDMTNTTENTPENCVELCSLSCNHAFHKNCFEQYINSCASINKKVNCVVCRKNIDE